MQTSRGKVANTQFSMAENGGSHLNTMFIFIESFSKRISQEVKNRRDSGEKLLQEL